MTTFLFIYFSFNIFEWNCKFLFKNITFQIRSLLNTTSIKCIYSMYFSTLRVQSYNFLLSARKQMCFSIYETGVSYYDFVKLRPFFGPTWNIGPTRLDVLIIYEMKWKNSILGIAVFSIYVLIFFTRNIPMINTSKAACKIIANGKIIRVWFPFKIFRIIIVNMPLIISQNSKIKCSHIWNSILSNL